MKLSQHFTSEEFECRCGCGFGRAHGDIDEDLIKFLESVRVFYGPMVVNSGCRCTYHNGVEGGHQDSPHLRGTAADIRVIGSTDRGRINSAIMTAAVLGGVVDDLGIGWGKTFVHIDLDKKLERPRAWTY